MGERSELEYQNYWLERIKFYKARHTSVLDSVLTPMYRAKSTCNGFIEVLRRYKNNSLTEEDKLLFDWMIAKVEERRDRLKH
jgi:hypothetical protein